MDCVRTDPPWVAAAKNTFSVDFRMPVPISFPFAGIGGPERACKEANWQITPKNVIEISKQKSRALSRLHGTGVVQNTDIRLIERSLFESSGGLVAGFPCTPHSLLGSGGGLDDEAGKLWHTLLDMVDELTGRTDIPLQWVVFENVAALSYNRASGCALDKIEDMWTKRMGSIFTPLHVWHMEASDYLLPQIRRRIFLYAHRWEYHRIVGGFPKQPPKFPKVALEYFLDLETDLDTTRVPTNRQLQNIEKFQHKFDAMFAADPNGSLHAVVDCSRRVPAAGEKTVKSKIHRGHMPTFTCSNRYLYLIKAKAGGSSPYCPEGGRLLSLRGRAIASGVCLRSLTDVEAVD